MVLIPASSYLWTNLLQLPSSASSPTSRPSRLVDYELLTQDHFAEWGAAITPKDILGAACRVNGELVALGGVWWIEDRGWAVFDRREGCPLSVHRVALQILDTVDRLGINELWAEIDDTKPRAADWLMRCGFEPTETQGVWRRGRPRYDDDDRVHGFVRGKLCDAVQLDAIGGAREPPCSPERG